MNSIFDFAQRTYEMEIERKDRINASLSFPAGVVALLAGVVTLFAERETFRTYAISIGI